MEKPIPHIALQYPFIGKIYDYGILAKFKLTGFILLSAAAGYGVAVHGNFSWFTFIALLLGGFLVTASSNAINQILERNFDAMMSRTANRPLAAERMSLMEAMVAAGIAGIAGVCILWFYCNQLCGIIGALSLLSYAFVYTPLKRISPISVWVGAIPGALPPLIGVVAAHGQLSALAWTMFGIQFLWQFPHFWAIAWVADEDYTRAGYKMLPSKEGKDKVTAMFSISYSLLLLPIGVLPTYMGWCGNIAMIVNILMGAMMLFFAINLFIKIDNSSARKLMFSSFIYLPVVLIAMVIDKL